MIPASDRKRFYADLLERAVWTFLQAFAGVLVADGALSGVDLPISAKLTAAAVAGVVAVGKALVLGQLVGNQGTASTLPKALDPATKPAVDDSPPVVGEDGRTLLATLGIVLIVIGVAALALTLLDVVAVSPIGALLVAGLGGVLLLVDGSSRR